jgi:5'(3')-deoxyribonucleotidase
MKRLTIAVDIDGTLRDIDTQMDKYLEVDHPDKIDKFREIKGDIYRALDPVFDTNKEVYAWMYEERVFELFGMAERMHRKVIDDLNIFANVAREHGFDVVIASVQRNQSVTATMHWLAKWGCKIQRYEFFHSMQDKIDRNFDIYIDDCPQVIAAFVDCSIVHPTESAIAPIPRMIKIPYNFTKDYDCPSLDIANGNFDDLYDILRIEKVLKQ